MNRRELLLGSALTVLSGSVSRSADEAPFHRAELIAPLDALHNHASCIVQCPDGSLLVSWYRGSGERTADDVAILGVRRSRRGKQWSEPFPMADTPGFPDCNPAMFIDGKRRLHLFWPLIVANEWHTAILMSRISERYQGSGAPVWNRERPILLKPGEDFARVVNGSVERDLRVTVNTLPAEQREAARTYLETRRKNANDKYFRRMGWMPRVHPTTVSGGRILLPLYSDGFDFSLIAISDDGGDTWRASQPIVGDGPVQPSIVERRDGSLVAYLRDNGRPPKRVQISESRDRGETWSPARDTDLLNSGTGVEVLRLQNGHWLLVNNDTEQGRARLTVSLSEDEGRSWRWRRALEDETGHAAPGYYSYPSIIQASDGSIHVTYTYSIPASRASRNEQNRPLREAIKHAHFNEAWVRNGTRA